MPRIADFVVIADQRFDIAHNDEGGFQETRNFNLGTDVHLPSKSLLSFVLHVFDGADDLAVRIQINGSTQFTCTVSFNGTGSRFHSMQEVVAGDVLVHGTNTIKFNSTSGNGTFGISDVVLHVQRDI